jgi:hypothetical protein
LNPSANVRREINCYSDRFADRCWMVIDDYLGGADKSARLRNASGRVGQRRAIAAVGLLWFRNVDRSLANPVIAIYSSVASANVRREEVLSFRI